MYLYNDRIIASDKLDLSFGSEWLNYGLGCFETLLVEDGQVKDEELHFLRAQECIQKYYEVSLSMWTLSQWKKSLYRYLEVSAIKKDKLYRLKLYFVLKNDAVDFYANLFPYHREKTKYIKLNFFYNSEDYFPVRNCEYKLLNYENHLRLKMMAQRKNYFDSIRVSRDGSLLESSNANLIFQVDGQMYTPPGKGILRGIERAKLLKSNNISERKIFLADNKKIERVWLVNSLINQLEVDEIESWYLRKK